MHHKYWFASDNVAGVCPPAQAGLLQALADSAPPYGEDTITRQAQARLCELFETECAVHFVFTGTAANALALAALCDSYHSALVHEFAHVQTDECNAPEFFRAGLKLQTIGGPRGKLDPAAVKSAFQRETDVHFSPLRALSLTQMTELGAVYTPAEVRALAELAHAHNAYIHMDGARFANAVAQLDVSPADLSWRAGVDILCFGGTKQGMPATEAVLIFRPELAQDFAYRVKQAGQLGSKLRVLSGPWLGMLADDAWLDYARHANHSAQQLARTVTRTVAHTVARFPALEVLEPVQGNAVFVALPDAVAQALHARGWHFYRFTPQHYRLMCSWATTAEQIEQFAQDLDSVLQTL